MKNPHHYHRIVLFIGFLLTALCLPIFGIKLSSINFNILPSSSVHFPIEFNATQAYEDIRTQLDFGYRVPGTMEHNACADWIRDELQPVTDDVVTHDFELTSIHCQNILGKLNTNKSNIIIIAAHWDSRAIAEKDRVNQSQPIPGANDGGSGVAVALELARVFYRNRNSFDSQIWFLFFDAEDQGSGGIPGWGWAEGAYAFRDEIDHYYNSSTENFSFFILLDMVGGHDLQFVDEQYSNEELRRTIFQEGRDLGYYNAFPKNPKTMWITDDHRAFTSLMPTLDLIIDFVNGPWTHHHTHADNLENINVKSLEATGSTVESFIYTYHGQTTWNQNYTKWIVFGSVGLAALIGAAIGVLIIKKKRRKIAEPNLL